MAKVLLQIQGENKLYTFQGTKLEDMCELMRSVLPMEHYIEHEYSGVMMPEVKNEDRKVVCFIPIDRDGSEKRKQVNLMGVK